MTVSKIALYCASCFCLVFLANNVALADGNGAKSMSIGLGVGVSNTAEDADFKASGTPANLYFDWNIDQDWLKFRFGFGTTESTMSYTVWSKDWKHTLTSNMLYAAWRYDYDMNSLVDGLSSEAHFGLSQITSELATNNGVAAQATSTLGTVFGAGVVYAFGDFGVGLQVDSHSGTAKFDNQSVATGSTQVQAAVTYSF